VGAGEDKRVQSESDTIRNQSNVISQRGA